MVLFVALSPSLVGRVEAKPLVVEPPKMEAEKELEIVNELIGNCEADLKVKDCDEKALTMTLLSLKKRRAAAKVCCVEPPLVKSRCRNACSQTPVYTDLLDLEQMDM